MGLILVGIKHLQGMKHPNTGKTVLCEHYFSGWAIAWWGTSLEPYPRLAAAWGKMFRCPALGKPQRSQTCRRFGLYVLLTPPGS